MKEVILLIILLLVSGLIHAQVDELYRTIRIRGLLKGMDITELINDNKFQGYPMKFQGIKVVEFIPNDTINILGQFNRDVSPSRKHYLGTILLKENILLDTQVAEMILAHEIGHLLGLKHDAKFTIMQPIAITQRGEDYNRMYVNNQAIWDKYFNKILNATKQ